MIASLRQLWARLTGAGRNEKKKLGDEAEAEAARFLREERGLKILARNWRSPKDRRDELDIVCRGAGGTLVFVEVKSRESDRLEQGYHAVDKRKKAALRRAVGAYLRGLGPRGREVSHRFDIVVIERAGRGWLVAHHFENVPLFSRGKFI